MTFEIIYKKRTFYSEEYTKETTVQEAVSTIEWPFSKDSSKFGFFLRESWLESTQSLIGNFLPPVEERWFNIDEQNVEEYQSVRGTS